VPVRHAELVVIVEIVRCGQDRYDIVEVVLPQPDDLFLASDSTMVGAKTTGTFTDGQFVLDEPGEVAWRDS